MEKNLWKTFANLYCLTLTACFIIGVEILVWRIPYITLFAAIFAFVYHENRKLLKKKNSVEAGG